MHTPTKAQWQLVIDNLKSVLPMASSNIQLDMNEGRVNSDDHKCGTVHCVGGWFAIATLDNEQELNYNDGALSMAAHLGFKTRSQLEIWAHKHPNIWGNSYGFSMFNCEMAYGFDVGGLGDVVAHLEGVRDRSPE